MLPTIVGVTFCATENGRQCNQSSRYRLAGLRLTFSARQSVFYIISTITVHSSWQPWQRNLQQLRPVSSVLQDQPLTTSNSLLLTSDTFGASVAALCQCLAVLCLVPARCWSMISLEEQYMWQMSQ